MNILVLNCGSSSIKFQLLAIDGSDLLLAKGKVDRVGFDTSCFCVKVSDGEEYDQKVIAKDHRTGIDIILNFLTDKEIGVLNSLNDIDAVGHRVAHGGEKFNSSQIINDDVKRDIRECFELAPLHNPANYEGILAVEQLMPGKPQIAVFDTAFHSTIPDYAFLYPLPYHYYKDLHVRRYGFHGTSHAYVAEKASRILGKEFSRNKIITCHLGNGASITAIEYGKSVDTSMGFTPNDGLMMGTRSGSFDPGALLYIAQHEDLSIEQVSDVINRKSGVLGVSEISSDMRDLVLQAEAGNEKARLALKMYAHRVRKFIGSYIAVMNGLDILVFTGGIGENNSYIRKLCCENMDALGIWFDSAKNDGLRGRDEIISLPGSKVTVMTISTNEELVIARETYRLLKK